MANYEIEKKFLIQSLPGPLSDYPSLRIEQAYLCTDPTIRIRRQNDEYILTYKAKGLMMREEYNLPLTQSAYETLLPKTEGNVISKTRYLIPLPSNQEHIASYTVELDVFDPPFAPLILAEVEFEDEKAAETFVPPAWFGKEVTYDKNYHNSNMSKRTIL